MSQTTLNLRPGLQDLERYRTMRDTNPVWRDPRTGFWNVYRYADVVAVLGDYQTFSSDFTGVFSDMSTLTDGNIVAMDPRATISFEVWSAKRSLRGQSLSSRRASKRLRKNSWIGSRAARALSWSRRSPILCR